jgi:toxin ParE1/3/4
MAEVVVTAAARADLVEIRLHSIREFDAQVADDYFLGFDQAFDRLADFPMSGRPEPGLGKDLRCLVHRKHRIFYRVSGARVLIVRVVHSAMDARRAMRERAFD